MLVDSLLRGWPFGSLLVWNYGQDQSRAIEMPHRRFWKEVDRTDGDAGTDVPAATLPATTPFRMVSMSNSAYRACYSPLGAMIGE